MPSMHIGFRADDGLVEDLQSRAGDDQSLAIIARTDLIRYYALLDDARRGLTFREREINLIAEANNGASAMMDRSVNILRQSLVMCVTDAVTQNKMHLKWGLSDDEAQALVGRLMGLRLIDAVALMDAVERFWAAPERMDTVQFFREQGLRVAEG